MIDGRNGVIQLASGVGFNPLDPDPALISIGDIAHALARVGRFTGHTRGDHALSVAQHSVAVSRACPPEYALYGLTHDASEAYIADVSAPLKHLYAFSAYREIEARLQSAIYVRFGLDPVLPDAVACADRRALAAEVRDLMTPGPIWGPWLAEIEPLPETVVPWPTKMAETVFLAEFRKLYPG